MRVWQTVTRSCSKVQPLTTHILWRQRHKSIAEVFAQEDGQNLTVKAFVKGIRKSKRVTFLLVNDGTSTSPLQVVASPANAAKLSYGSAVEVQGELKKVHGRPHTHELQADALRILGDNDAEGNPLQNKYQTNEFLRTIAHLRSRTIPQGNLLKLRSATIAHLTSYFFSEGFVQCHTPVITSSDCEGAGEVFNVSSAEAGATDGSRGKVPAQHFFRKPKYLTVSAQLHLEALALAVRNVWTLSPTFRAEQSDTPRHLSEFYMLEAEMCFMEDLNEVMDVVENMLRGVTASLLRSIPVDEDGKKKLAFVYGSESWEGSKEQYEDMLAERWNGLLSPSWPRITYADAVKLLEEAHQSKKASFAMAPSYDGGLQAEHERYIATTVGQGNPVFVTDYPSVQKPFYMSPSLSTKNSKGTGDTVACFDLLVPELCELAGGSLREHRAEELSEAMKQKGVAGTNLEWYQDLRKFGSAPHGGFGLGFDRLICYLAGVGNVRDVVAFPRWYGRCDC